MEYKNRVYEFVEINDKLIREEAGTHGVKDVLPLDS